MSQVWFDGWIFLHLFGHCRLDDKISIDDGYRFEDEIKYIMLILHCFLLHSETWNDDHRLAESIISNALPWYKHFVFQLKLHIKMFLVTQLATDKRFAVLISV